MIKKPENHARRANAGLEFPERQALNEDGRLSPHSSYQSPSSLSTTTITTMTPMM